MPWACASWRAEPYPRGWLARGHALLERLILEQFAPDGWYIQHSFTYLRLALDQCVVAERCLRAVGLRLSTPAVERLTAAAGLLEMLLEAESGIVPNHGPNDGAFVHPITSGSYRDFRPVVTAVSALWDRPLPADLAPDRETLAWLGLESPPSGPARDDGLVVGDSGWAFVRSGEVELFLRAGSYESRPGHVDPLHIDVRIGGQEVVVDPGTFAYSAPAPWHNGLAGHDVHNGPQVEGKAPGLKGPRFLWYLWPSARTVDATWDPARGTIVAEAENGARRTVIIEADQVVIRDELMGAVAIPWTVQWLLHPDAHPSWLSTQPEARSIPGSEGDVTGWFSAHYAERRRGHTFEVVGPSTPGAPIITTIRRCL